VFITHDLDEALRLGDRVAIMKDGRVVQEGAPVEIVGTPADDYVAAFVEDVDRARVLRLEHIMTAPTPAADATAALPADTLLGDALTVLASSPRPLAVQDGEGRIVGEVRASDALAAMARGRRGAAAAATGTSAVAKGAAATATPTEVVDAPPRPPAEGD
jgi:glycine betaine/proline transport system ATP-binding protein